ncbi:MAG: helix-turn-helix transcriptional regulator [Symploca sp. SIO2E9]|nr:helix-turn-helix transcriptional regulator [Symploca sp. SIO2E9]
MGKASQALRQVLKIYGISQNKLAVTMGIGRSTIHYWYSGTSDPSAETVLEIRKALRKINPAAAQEFISLYLDESDENKEQS